MELVSSPGGLSSSNNMMSSKAPPTAQAPPTALPPLEAKKLGSPRATAINNNGSSSSAFPESDGGRGVGGSNLLCSLSPPLQPLFASSTTSSLPTSPKSLEQVATTPATTTHKEKKTPDQNALASPAATAGSSSSPLQAPRGGFARPSQNTNPLGGSPGGSAGAGGVTTTIGSSSTTATAGGGSSGVAPAETPLGRFQTRHDIHSKDQLAKFLREQMALYHTEAVASAATATTNSNQMQIQMQVSSSNSSNRALFGSIAAGAGGSGGGEMSMSHSNSPSTATVGGSTSGVGSGLVRSQECRIICEDLLCMVSELYVAAERSAAELQNLTMALFMMRQQQQQHSAGVAGGQQQEQQLLSSDQAFSPDHGGSGGGLLGFNTNAAIENNASFGSVMFGSSQSGPNPHGNSSGSAHSSNTDAAVTTAALNNSGAGGGGGFAGGPLPPRDEPSTGGGGVGGPGGRARRPTLAESSLMAGLAPSPPQLSSTGNLSPLGALSANSSTNIPISPTSPVLRAMRARALGTNTATPTASAEPPLPGVGNGSTGLTTHFVYEPPQAFSALPAQASQAQHEPRLPRLQEPDETVRSPKNAIRNLTTSPLPLTQQQQEQQEKPQQTLSEGPRAGGGLAQRSSSSRVAPGGGGAAVGSPINMLHRHNTTLPQTTTSTAAEGVNGANASTHRRAKDDSCSHDDSTSSKDRSLSLQPHQQLNFQPVQVWGLDEQHQQQHQQQTASGSSPSQVLLGVSSGGPDHRVSQTLPPDSGFDQLRLMNARQLDENTTPAGSYPRRSKGNAPQGSSTVSTVEPTPSMQAIHIVNVRPQGQLQQQHVDCDDGPPLMPVHVGSVTSNMTGYGVGGGVDTEDGTTGAASALSSFGGTTALLGVGQERRRSKGNLAEEPDENDLSAMYAGPGGVTALFTDGASSGADGTDPMPMPQFGTFGDDDGDDVDRTSTSETRQRPQRQQRQHSKTSSSTQSSMKLPSPQSGRSADARERSVGDTSYYSVAHNKRVVGWTSGASEPARSGGVVGPNGATFFADDDAFVTGDGKCDRDDDDFDYEAINQYTVIDEIGRGASGSVFLAVDTETDEPVAIKAVVCHAAKKRRRFGATANAMMMGNMEKVQREIGLMKRMRHPNIVTLREVIEDPDEATMFLVMDYVPNGPVVGIDAASGKCAKVGEDLIVTYAHQMASALRYLHKKKIIHRDIKPDNVLLGDNNVLFIADFGISVIRDQQKDLMEKLTANDNESAAVSSVSIAPTGSQSNSNSREHRAFGGSSGSNARRITQISQKVREGSGSVQCVGAGGGNFSPKWGNSNASQTLGGNSASSLGGGHGLANSGFGHVDMNPGTPAFSPPELLQGSIPTTACDAWSLGVTLYSMMFGKLPFLADSYQETIRIVVDENHKLDYPVDAPPMWVNALQQLLQHDPKMRPTMAQFLQHPLFAEYACVRPQFDAKTRHKNSDSGSTTGATASGNEEDTAQQQKHSPQEKPPVAEQEASSDCREKDVTPAPPPPAEIAMMFSPPAETNAAEEASREEDTAQKEAEDPVAARVVRRHRNRQQQQDHRASSSNWSPDFDDANEEIHEIDLLDRMSHSPSHAHPSVSDEVADKLSTSAMPVLRASFAIPYDDDADEPFSPVKLLDKHKRAVPPLSQTAVDKIQTLSRKGSMMLVPGIAPSGPHQSRKQSLYEHVVGSRRNSADALATGGGSGDASPLSLSPVPQLSNEAGGGGRGRIAMMRSEPSSTVGEQPQEQLRMPNISTGKSREGN